MSREGFKAAPGWLGGFRRGDRIKAAGRRRTRISDSHKTYYGIFLVMANKWLAFKRDRA
jgi:hypothetical protein